MIGVKEEISLALLSFGQSTHTHRHRATSHFLERHIAQRELGYRMYPIGVALPGFRRLLPALKIARGVQQPPAKGDHAGVSLCALGA